MQKRKKPIGKRRMARLRRQLRMLATAVMILAFAVAVVLIGIEIWENVQAKALKEELEDLYRPHFSSAARWQGWIGTARAEEELPEKERADEAQFAQELGIQEDFLALYDKNPDIIGWLTAGEDIDYPVVQREDDNAYYLNHNYYGKPDSNGTIFLNAHNVIYPRDHVLLIHGHFMRKKGMMFGKLPDYMNEMYMRRYALITFRTIYDEEEVYYVPIACFNASMLADQNGYFDLTPVNFETEEDCAAYLIEVQERSLWQSPADVNTKDELMMLITCSYEHEDGRFMLLCRKLREDETPEEMAVLFQQNKSKKATD